MVCQPSRVSINRIFAATTVSALVRSGHEEPGSPIAGAESQRRERLMNFLRSRDQRQRRLDSNEDRLRARLVSMPTPSSRVLRMRAVDLTNRIPGYLFREHGDDDDAWKRVKARVVCELQPHEGSVLPELVTVTFTDGTERYFNPEDQVEIRPG